MTTRDDNRPPKHAADGDVPPWWSAISRRRLALALGSTFVAVPVVVLDNLPHHEPALATAVEAVDAPSTTERTVHDALDRLPSPDATAVTVAVQAPAQVPPSTTTSTAAPTTTTTAAPPTTRPAPTTTTTAAPAPPPTTAPQAVPAAAPSSVQAGLATWYRYRAGECAHKTLPKGTVVTIRNTRTGTTATCVVTDRGPYGRNRIIDLDDGTFATLAPLSRGVIDVTISW